VLKKKKKKCDCESECELKLFLHVTLFLLFLTLNIIIIFIKRKEKKINDVILKLNIIISYNKASQVVFLWLNKKYIKLLNYICYSFLVITLIII
jgi:hypothetical protein